MTKLNYEEQQIVALRTAVQMIAAVLDDTQKEILKNMLHAPKDMMINVVPEDHLEEAQKIMVTVRDILRLD